MALTNEYIIQRLKEKFGEDLFTFQESYGLLELVAPKEMNLKVLNFLYDDAQLQFRFL
ncbi:MAG: NADH-quinone oxidoreductase subunit C, partial [Chitinophagaceae bacterium]|nr:NADH-quinone oxidoreductase subunit C [Chitinophagaceae bacterium]